MSARNFQLLVTDYDLGWTNGFEILKHVKKRYPEVPVIMFTGTGDQETAVRAMKEGVADYVVKSAMHGTRLRISARTALDHYRQRAILKENEKLAIIGRLTAVIAHEIKNPLDAVSNLLYLTEKDPQKVGEYLPLARREISRIEQITNRTIGFYRQSPQAARVNVGEILDDILALYERRLEFENISVRKTYRELELTSFPDEVRQVCSNLILNAIDAIGQNGTITLRVRASRSWTNFEQAGIRITVADTGLGIASENRGRVFEAFFTTKGQKGVGLGLWVTKTIVEQRGGSIRVHSLKRPDGSGTCFSVFFPNEPPASANP